jgi:hypothetical protein
MLGLVKGEGFAVDASVMEADASRYHGKAPDEIDWSAPERQTRAAAECNGRVRMNMAGIRKARRNCWISWAWWVPTAKS